MDLTGFIDVDARNKQQFAEFLDLNMFAHETTHNALLEAGTIVEHYPMFTDTADNDWLEIHYREHSAWSSALSLATPPDLSIVDLSNPDEAADWLTNHSAHHALVNQSLSI